MNVKNNKKLNVVDFFCGCGGLSFGFAQAGCKVVLGIDNDEIALKTFMKNHPDTRILNEDLTESGSIVKIKKILNNKKIDVIIGGPPCQGFSLTGSRNYHDERNILYKSIFKTAALFRPKAIVIENVPGLLTLYKGQFKEKILDDFRKLNYTVTVQLVCAADYGVPQLRKRIFFVGLQEFYGKYIFPGKTHSPGDYITCSEAIDDLPSRENEIGEEIDKYDKLPRTNYQKRMRENSNCLHNHVATNHTEYVKKVISLVPEGGNYKNLPPGVGESRKFNEAWTRYYSNKPSKTIDTGHRNHFHYKYNRIPTVRENARLQSFPDNFIFFGNKTQQYKQVGNAVSPLLGYHIANKLLGYIK